MTSLRVILNVGDEEGFISYAEKVIFEMQRIWRGNDKEGMESFGLIDLCSRVEDLVYQDSLREYNLPESANVWSKRECMIFYQEKCEDILRSLEYKKLNWKKVFEENERNPRAVLNILLRDVESKPAKKSVPISESLKKLKTKAAKATAKKTATSTVPKVTKKKATKEPDSSTATNNVNTTPSTINLSQFQSMIHSNHTYDLNDKMQLNDNIEGDGDSEALVGDLGFDFNNDDDLPLGNLDEIIDTSAWMA
mmetsp:Transcript_9370/g.14004  ORF Transcript_9370/g.14004 Transcript_9370/m.14004 type:complete len:251 (+) Transcript_9370:39-791(+)|eukprot:CAMPEP_0170062576 /NCGR_PEP_ID=MMETSP0019_2-20121128/3752_1 /TAXON_ID=98059 /ORGANISM="Dinobryon sp., Strain UTEXLB2267" /LENGTH=250 /DNA_ID=CAMNT_0010268761 /DNA_START=37 /DNA_END=789 /DNA_ORIENTATION=-